MIKLLATKVQPVVSLFCATLFLVIYNCDAIISVGNNGGYKITVAFSSDLKPTDKLTFKNNAEKLFQEASKALCVATHQKAYFDEVTFLYPRLWVNDGDKPSTIESFETSPFQVIESELINSKAIQYGGCGQTGRRIVIPTSLLDHETSKEELRQNSLILAREWAYYRYGVFDEHGYRDNPLYPIYYSLAGKTSSPNLTNCANTELQLEQRSTSGDLCTVRVNDSTGLPINNECHLRPIKDSNFDVISSLAFTTQLQNISKFCGTDGETLHNKFSPNKQNALCQGQSIMEVISKSTDFKNSVALTPCDNIGDPSYKHIRESNLILAFINDNSKSMKDFYDYFGSSFKLFIEDEPPDNTLAYILSFPREMSLQNRILTDLKTRTNFYNLMLTDLYDEEANFISALNQSIQAFQQQTIHVLSITSVHTIAKVDLNELKSILRLIPGLRLHTILYRETDSEPVSNEFETIIKKSGGSITEISLEILKRDGISSFNILYGALKTFLGKDSKQKDLNQVFLREFKQNQTVEFATSDDVSNFLSMSFCLIQEYQKEPIIKKNEFGITFEGVTYYQNALPEEFNIKNENLKPAIIFCFIMKANPKITSYKLSFKNKPTITNNLYFTSTAELKPNTLSTMVRKLSFWTQWIETENSNGKALIFYASLFKGTLPIKNAQIKATIFRPQSTLDAEETSVFELDLFDNGIGDPDIETDDGIYSRYFTGFTEKGGYIIKLLANDNSGKAEILEDPQNNKWKSAGLFQNSIGHAKSFIINWEIDKVDVYPPNRVIDLRVIETKLKTIKLSWTAPGNDYDGSRIQNTIGQASTYIIKYFKHLDDARIRFDDQGVIVNEWKQNGVPIKPNVYGSTEILNVQLESNEYGGVLYFALKTMDEMNNTSPVSNIVRVYLAPLGPPPVIVTDDPSIANGTETFGDNINTNLSNAEIGIIVGSVLAALFLILLIIAILICIKRRKAKTVHQNGGTAANRYETPIVRTFREDSKPNFEIQRSSSIGHNGLVTSSPVDQINFVPATTIINHYDRVQEAKQNNQVRPILCVSDLLESFSDSSSMKQNSIYESMPEIDGQTKKIGKTRKGTEV